MIAQKKIQFVLLLAWLIRDLALQIKDSDIEVEL